MAKKTNVPEIRFAGFTDPWEQRKLGELGFAQSGIGFPNTEQGGTEGTPFFKVSDMNMSGNEHELVASNNYVTPEQISRMGWHPINQVPAIFFAKVGAAVMLNRKRLVNKPFLMDNNTMAFSMDSSLLNTQFGQLLFDRLDLTSLIQVGALPSYNLSDVESITVSLPSTMDEQRQIGECLCNINDLITLHQRKYDKLCAVKKSMLDKIFPKPGEVEPEIRFAGFTDPWEQRKLGELCTISKGHGYSKADIRDAGTPLILYGRLYTQYESRIEDVDTFAVEQEGSLLSKGNEVIVPASGETAEDIAVASSVRRSGIIFGGDLNVVTPVSKLDPDYTALAITYSKAHENLAKHAQGKSIVHIHGNDIAEVEIPYPSESEQKRISAVVLGLGNLITLHQREPRFADTG